MKASLGCNLVASHAHPCPSEAATNFGSLCSSKQVAQGWSQAMPNIDMHDSLPRSHRINTTTGLRPYQSTTQLSTQVAHPEGDPGRYQTLLGQIPHHGLCFHTAVQKLWLELILTISQLEVRPQSIKNQQR